MRKFSVGDRVRLVFFLGRPEIIGTITTITEILDPPVHGHEYVLDIEPRPGHVAVAAMSEHLEPYYDGHEKTSWSDCAWKPKEVRA